MEDALTTEGGLLQQLAKRLLESALERRRWTVRDHRLRNDLRSFVVDHLDTDDVVPVVIDHGKNRPRLPRTHQLRVVRMPPDVHSLGSLLRTWRERLHPTDVGLESFGLRRTKGLRREELAALAGISADYVVRLEQGRSLTPSAQVVASLARALQLDRTETELLHRAAGLTPQGPGKVSRHIPPGVQRMITRMADLPLAVFAADWTLLTSTPLSSALFGTPPPTKVPGQNLIVQTFVEETTAEAATPHGGAEAFERALVADLRRSASWLGDDPGFRSLITNVRALSPQFRKLWDEGRASAHQSLVKTVHHSLVGDVTLDCDVMTIPDSDIKLVVFTAPVGSTDAERLDFLRVGVVRTLNPDPPA
ncbi:helix-turn-helix transcriptional regulator [Streptomyces sp. NPDC060205]|uniref:helix-turn-helix transcriptional regulator n=1 Tax=Streptomyces sp. NPDC060205 TaxID=3347072 RepID=UPI0036506C50